MYCRFLFICAALLLLPTHAMAINVEITINGVDGGLYENVLAHLGVSRHKSNPMLTAEDVHRLYKKSDVEISEALVPFGYYSPEMSSSIEQKGENFSIIYEIDKGDPVLVSAIDVGVADKVGELDIFDDLIDSFPLQQGDILNHGLYENGKKSLLKKAFNNGFLDAVYHTQEVKVDRRTGKAEIVLLLDPGPQYVFGNTYFESTGVDPELLQTYIPYEPGEPYTTADLIELQKILYRTDYFSQVVVEGKVEESEGLSIPVYVLFSIPEKLNRYSVGLGYATDTGARARFDWRNRLFNTRGHTMETSVLASENDSEIGIDYKIPWGNPSDDKIAFSSSYTDQNWDDTDTRLISVGVGLEHKTKNLSHGGSIEYRDEDYSVGVTDGHVRLIMPSLHGNFILADSLSKTKYGIQISATVSGSLEGVASDVTFVKGTVGGKIIITPFPSWRLISRGLLGAAAVDSIDDLPPSLRFYTGGDQSIRGYGYKEIGSTDESGAVVGGRYLVVGSVEMEREYKHNLSFAAFWDVGNATDDLDLDFKQGAGGGIRYRLPFGQVRFDVACAILEDDTPVRLHLTVGADL